MQLVIGGRNKYLINGHIAQPGCVAFLACEVVPFCAPARPSHTSSCLVCRRVQNLFHSVQLNVNNPHFLIMQGRITKVFLTSLYFAVSPV